MSQSYDETTSAYAVREHYTDLSPDLRKRGLYGEAELLASCYRRSLEVAVENGLSTIAFPSISTGVFGYPVEQAAGVAVRAITAFGNEHPEVELSVTFALLGGRGPYCYQKAIEEYGPRQQ